MSAGKRGRRRYGIAAAVTALAIGAWTTGAQAQPPQLDGVIASWRAMQYEDVVRELTRIRREPYGKNIYVDYMLATSLCRMPRFVDLGQRYFLRLLASYDFSADQARLIEEEAGNCQGQPRQIAFDWQRGMFGSGGVRGKTFYWLDQQSAPLAAEPVKVVRHVPQEELTNRLFGIDERQAALEAANRRLSAGIRSLDRDFTITATDHFILASASGQTPVEMAAIGTHLEASREFFHGEFGMPRPTSLLSVYIVPHTHNLREFAKTIHGLQLGDGGIGYSFSQDLSLAAVASQAHTGTLKHELFHLMVRNDFGDIPPWLDEGMAALYEVSRIENERIVGLRNWREPVLRRFWQERPTVQELVGMDWRAFDADGMRLEQQATNHATARYFALFLQEEGTLSRVYGAFRAQEVDALVGHPDDAAVRVLEEALGKHVDAIDEAFAAWFLGLGELPSNQDVEDVQQRLNALGFDAGPADGLIGPRTRSALRAFQTENSLPVTGQIDVGTRAAIRSLTGKE